MTLTTLFVIVGFFLMFIAFRFEKKITSVKITYSAIAEVLFGVGVGLIIVGLVFPKFL